MKNITTGAAFVFLTILFVGGIPFDACAIEGAMNGRDPTYRGGVTGMSHGGSGGGHSGKTCSGAVQHCKKIAPASAAACVSAGESCKQSGTFTGPGGKSFPGLAKM
jgi:hypothetical protein